MEAVKKDRLVRITILVVGTLFLLAMAYGSGMRAQIGKVRAINEERKLAEQKYRDAQRKLRLRLAVVQLLEARRLVAVALRDLDARNFGMAQERTRSAVTLLRQAQEKPGVQPDLVKVAAGLDGLNLTGATDVAAAREPLLAAIREMDAALGAFVPGFLQESKQDDDANPIEPPTMNDVPLPPGRDVTRTQ